MKQTGLVPIVIGKTGPVLFTSFQYNQFHEKSRKKGHTYLLHNNVCQHTIHQDS